MSDEDVTLTSLVGEHVLTGVEFGTRPPDREAYRYDDSATISFVLDGITYTAAEDPSDGYRSSMERLFVGGGVANVFPPCRVVCSIRERGEYVLEMRDVTTGKIVVEVGTSNTDDYYPCYEARFDPTAMAVNAGKP